MSDSPVNMSRSGPPETVLPPEPPETRAAIEGAAAAPDRRAALSEVAASWPKSSLAWATLGDSARDVVEAYAAYRVGYHRGLDSLRQNGWRGSGYVRWAHESNRGFLRSLAGLQRAAEEIGEEDEALRCRQFLDQLDPDWPPGEL